MSGIDLEILRTHGKAYMAVFHSDSFSCSALSQWLPPHPSSLCK